MTLTDLASKVDAATSPLEVLEALRHLRGAVLAEEAEAVAAARAAGASWGEVGRRLGVSRQAAQQRHTGSPRAKPLERPDGAEGETSRAPTLQDIPRGRRRPRQQYDLVTRKGRHLGSIIRVS